MSDSHEVVLTTGNAHAMLDRETLEVMHPIVGPLVEAPMVYIRPSRLAERLREPGDAPLVLFDIGLGAGSNAIAARRVSETLEVDPDGPPRRRLHVVSFDRTVAAMQLALEPDHAAAFDLEGASGDAARAVLATGHHETEQTRWTMVLGELPDVLATHGQGLADLVFWDPFSPRSNPTLWTRAAFIALREACGPKAIVHTYSSATSIRSALLLAGFCVGRGGPSASKDQTTVAAFDRDALERPLEARFLERLSRSSAPFPTDAPADAMAQIEAHRQFAG